MFQENEVITLLIGTVGVVFVFIKRRVLAQSVPSWRWLLAAYFYLYIAWAFTVLEGLFLPRTFNVLEHTAYMLSSFLIAIWAIKALVAASEEEP
ncbi:MAG: hypothetical protein P1S46_12080 [bacterium]|nr:hypothetical protein [bacterium]MDT8396537.1 hypothetical protein [bacterium]